MRCGFYLAIVFFSVLVWPWTQAIAQETQPGDACTVAGEIRVTGGPEQSAVPANSVGQMLICDGATWNMVAKYGQDGSTSLRVGPDFGCNATKKGRMRYDANRNWEFCNGKAWKPFQGASKSGCNGPTSCPYIGSVCADGSVYVGCHPRRGMPLFMARCDTGLSGSNCTTGTRTKHAWNNATANYKITNKNNAYDGGGNSAALYTLDSATTAGVQPHNAAKECEDMNVHSNTDWYLPSSGELDLVLNGANFSQFTASTFDATTAYWTSTEKDISNARAKTTIGETGNYLKDYLGNVRCFRKGEDACDGNPAVGTVCADGSVYAGLSPDQSRKMYAQRCDIDQYWDTVSNSCQGAGSTMAYSSAFSETYANNTVSGRENTIQIALRTDYDYPAAQACYESSAHDKSDWYLPATDELAVLNNKKDDIGNFAEGEYWSSTQNFNWVFACMWDFSDESSTCWVDKRAAFNVRCVRLE